MPIQSILFVAAIVLAMIVFARLVNQFLMKTHLSDALIKADNPALGVAIAGYVFGVVIITTAVMRGEGSGDWLQDALVALAYGAGGVLFLAFISLFGFKLFHSVDYLEEIEKRNVAVGVVAAGRFVATGLVIAGAISGDSKGGTPLTTLVFFLVGQLALVAISRLYRLLTNYNDTQEFIGGNMAAALSYAGVMIGIGIAVGNGLRGDFIDYETSFLGFGKSLLVIVSFYPIRQFLVQGVLLGGGFALRGGKLDEEIRKDRNVGASVIEAMAYVATAILVTELS
ncbi:MAG: DUF350 domain-containing protein [Chloroherpetonaceae bacterium]|nr:DUF350 domain-containing protein [Chloroherpetonaceae bacterium]MDW8438260.1 DUF350 domain-containing protein [Chloroherpetonaceae bacterium]